MPWAPELFTTPTLERLLEEREAERLSSVPFFDGLMTGEMDALIGSFAGEPQLHHPVLGRIKGVAAFTRFATATRAWLAHHNATSEDVDLALTPERGSEEAVLHLDVAGGRVGLPVASVADHSDDGRIIEFRIYFSGWPLTGGHALRVPLLQADPDVHAPGIIGDYQRALAAGNADAVVAAFEPDAYLREPAGGEHIHRGTDELHALYERFFSNGGGIRLEHCSLTDDGRACAIEYNVTRWGRTQLPPQAGVAVYVRGDSGKLAAARIYDDADPPLGRP